MALTQYHMNMITKAESDGKAVAIMTTGGAIVHFVSGVKFDHGFLFGTDNDGDVSFIEVSQIGGFTLAAFAMPSDETMGQAVMLEHAFIQLRSACEASKDPDVQKALAVLVAAEEVIEEAREAGSND